MFDEKKINRIIKNTKNSGDFLLSYGKNGFPVLKALKDGCSFFINSKYNPEKEACDFINEYDFDKDLFIYGIGMGFHIKAAAKRLALGRKMYVLELNPELLKLAFENTDIKEFLKRDNIVFDIPETLNEVLSFIKEKGAFEENVQFICHEPSEKVIPEKFIQIKEIFDTYLIKTASFSIFDHFISENERINLSKNYENGGKVFKDRFKGKRAIVVSAGPSLEINGEKLKYIKDTTIIAVGRAFEYLTKIGVKPDFVIIIDAQDMVLSQLDFDYPHVPLFILSSANYKIEKYKGKKYILFETFSDKISEEDRKYTVETGGSVATTALSLAHLMGFSEILLIGQDLCYHSNLSHAGENKSYIHLKNQKTVKGIDGETYYSPDNLYEYLKWFRNFAKRHKDLKLVNCTAKGAYIDGFEHKSIDEYIEIGV